jgi:hypothetical protein
VEHDPDPRAAPAQSGNRLSERIMQKSRSTPLRSPHGDDDGKHNNCGGHNHPILEMHAKDLESLDKHIQGRFPGCALEAGHANRKINYFVIFLGRPDLVAAALELARLWLGQFSSLQR